jgi:hypothetical protein
MGVAARRFGQRSTRALDTLEGLSGNRLEMRKTDTVRHRSIDALFGLRLVLVSNIILLTVIGGLCLAYYERPEAYLFAGSAWFVDAVLVWLVRFTDPYRQPRPRRRRTEPREGAK